MTGRGMLFSCFWGILPLIFVAVSYENVALHTPAWQKYSHEARWGAYRAVDGLYTNLAAAGNQCTISGNGRLTAELWLDLGKALSIHHIFIQYRTDNADWGESNAFAGRFLGYSVYLSNTTNKDDGVLCFRDTKYTRATIPTPVNITCPYHGKYVIYYNNRTHRPAGYSTYAFNELCCPTPGFYDENCSLVCPRNCQESRCHITNGTCLGCIPGYEGPRCDTECYGSKYGTACSQTCGECFRGEQCDHVTGNCPNGCGLGMFGEKCVTECTNGFYGLNCLKACSRHCWVAQRCHRITGECQGGCHTGWKKPTCEAKCDNGTFGIDCTAFCGNCEREEQCHHINGTCMNGCNSSYSGTLCTKELILVDVNENDNMCTAFYGVLALLVVCVLYCALRMIRTRDGCNHTKQTKSNYPNVVGDSSGIYDQVQENAGYQELGQVSIPTVYETLA